MYYLTHLTKIVCHLAKIQTASQYCRVGFEVQFELLAPCLDTSGAVVVVVDAAVGGVVAAFVELMVTQVY